MADLNQIASQTWEQDELASGWKMAGLTGTPWTPPTAKEEAVHPAISPNPADTLAALDDYLAEWMKSNPREAADFISGLASGTGPAGPMMGGIKGPAKSLFASLLEKVFGKAGAKPGTTPSPVKSTPSEPTPTPTTGKGEIVAPGGSQVAKTDAPEAAVTGAKPKGRLLQRFEESGVAPGTPDKPHGVYTTPAEVRSPHRALAGEQTLWQLSPDAKVLKIDPFPGQEMAMRRGATDAGAGVHAARKLLGDEIFTTLKQGTKVDAMRYAQEHYPGPNYTKYADKQEVIEAIGAQEARRQGYDAIDVRDLRDPAFDEVVLLNERAASRLTPSVTKPKVVAPVLGPATAVPDAEVPGMVSHPIKGGGELRIDPLEGRVQWLGPDMGPDAPPLKLAASQIKQIGDELADLYPNLGVLNATRSTPKGQRTVVIDLNAIRRKRTGIPDPVADKLTELVAAERFTQGSKRVLPNEVSKALGRDLSLTEAKVMEHPEFEALSPYFYARLELVKKAHAEALAAYKAGPTPEADDLLKANFQQYIGLQANLENFLEESARTLQAGRDETFQWLKTAGAQMKQKLELHEAMYPNIPISGKIIRRMIDSQGFEIAAKDLAAGKRYGWDMWVSYWMSNAFSNPRTPTINLVNAYANTLKQAASRELGAASQKVVGVKPLSEAARAAGEREALVQGEGLVQLSWNLQGFTNTLKSIKESWTGGGVFGMYRDFITAPRLEHVSKLEAVPNAPAISSENVIKGILYHRGKTLGELDPDGLLRPLLNHLDATSKAGQAIDIVGKAIHTPLQALEQGDRASYQMMIYGARAADAHARGVLEGLEGDALAAFIDRVVTNPPMAIETAAKRLTLHELYRDSIKSGMVKGAMSTVAKYPILRLAQLIYKTPFNMMRNMLEDLPLANRLVQSVNDDYAAGGARASLARGRMMFGTMAVSTYAWMAYNDQITGAGPSEPRARAVWEKTHKPHSIALYVDEKDPSNKLWFPTAVLGSHGMLMSMVADATQMSQWASATPAALDATFWDKMERAVYYPVVSIAKDATNNIWMQGFINLIDAIQPNPGETEVQAGRRAQRFLERAGSLFLPAHSLLKDQNKEVNTLMDDLRATVPFWSSTLKAKLDDFGDVDYSGMLNTTTGLGPVVKSQEMNRVVQEVMKNAPALQTLPRFLDGQELTGNEEHEFKRIRGQEVRFQGRTMKEDLKHLIDSPLYLRSTEGRDGSRSALLAAHYNYFTSKALDIMGREDAKFLNLKTRIEKESRKAGRPLKHPITKEAIGVLP